MLFLCSTIDQAHASYSSPQPGPGRFLELLEELEHFHFWCIQSNRSQRGFSSRKAAPSRAYLCRVEVKCSNSNPTPNHLLSTQNGVV